MVTEQLVLEKREQGVCVLTLKNPPVNALSDALLDALEAKVDQLAVDHEAKVVVITGAGSKAFVAGADISQFPNLDAQSGRDFSAKGHRIFNKIAALAQPVIAAVNGFALGGGCELALACDIRVVSANAQLGQPEVNLGLLPGYGGSQRLTRLVGSGKAKELIFSGQLVKAEEAYRIGLADRLVPEGEALEDALNLARLILGKGPLAVQRAKLVIDRGLDLPLAQGLELEIEAFGNLCGSEDQKEGARAFLEKRPAQFKRR